MGVGTGTTEDSPARGLGGYAREAEGAVGYGRLQQPCKVQRTGIAVHTLLAFTFLLSLRPRRPPSRGVPLSRRFDFSPRLVLSRLFLLPTLPPVPSEVTIPHLPLLTPSPDSFATPPRSTETVALSTYTGARARARSRRSPARS